MRSVAQRSFDSFEGQLRLRVHDQPLLVRERQLLEDLASDEDLLLRVLGVEKPTASGD
ncbi:MAG: hypothetical protein V2A73_04095 [Pseudomonadota bacterium]